MKKALIVMAVLIAVVASTTLGGVQTASAFNPQPEPPAVDNEHSARHMHSDWFQDTFPVQRADNDRGWLVTGKGSDAQFNPMRGRGVIGSGPG